MKRKAYLQLAIIMVVLFVATQNLNSKYWDLSIYGLAALGMLVGVLIDAIRINRLRKGVFSKGRVVGINALEEDKDRLDEVCVEFVSPIDNQKYNIFFKVNSVVYKVKMNMVYDVWVNEKDPTKSRVPNVTGYEKYSYLFKLFFFIVFSILFILTVVKT